MRAVAGAPAQEEAAKTYADVHAKLQAAAVKSGLGEGRIQSHVLRADISGVQGAVAVKAADDLGADVAVFGTRGMGVAKRCPYVRPMFAQWPLLHAVRPFVLLRSAPRPSSLRIFSSPLPARRRRRVLLLMMRASAASPSSVAAASFARIN